MISKSFKRAVSALMSSVMAAGIVSFSGASLPAPVQAATVISISPGDTYAINNGVFEGWGTSLCWWANRLGYSDSLAQQAADIFYGDDGLRLNIARFNIGGGDDPSHDHITRTDSNMPGYTKYQNGQVTYDWSADANQRNVLKRCVQAAGDNAIVEMFSNSPPYWMCKSGCSTGNRNAGQNNLKDDCYDDFAEYLAEVCKHYETEWGIKVQSVEALNEPYTNYWGAFSFKQEGCHFDIGESESKIITELQKSMAKRGMQDVILCGTDETSIDTQIDAYNKLYPEAKQAITRIDTHTYGGSKRTELKNTAVAAGKNLWMSEVDGNGEAGQNAGAMAPGLWLSERITADCNGLNASAWILWQVIDKHVCAAGYNGKKDSGMVDMTKGFWGTAVADHDQNTIVLSKKYYCFGQYTRYIRPGMIMLNSSNKTMAAFDKENGRLVLVAYNTSAGASDISFDLSQFDEFGTSAQAIRTSNTENWKDIGATPLTGSYLNVSLAPNSVTTFLIDGVKGGIDLNNQIEPVEISGTESWKNTASTNYTKAFDGNTSTYFDGLGGGWVMADLGAVYDITALGFAPRAGYEARCVDAYIEVSEDGQQWTTVYTVASPPSAGMHYVKPNASAIGRYVRYAVPEGKPNNGYNKDDTYCCNIAELAFFGEPSAKTNLTKIPVDIANVTSTEAWKQSENDGKMAFDGNTATYFDGVGNGWVQADLGALYDIKMIGYCPRKNLEYRCIDGEFLISQNGEDWKKVYTINGKQTFGMHFTPEFDGENIARYVRYRVPEGAPTNPYNTDSVYCCNIAEIELYGEQVGEITINGDVNADGACNTADAVMLVNYLLTKGKLTDAAAADLNGDRQITAVDLALLKKMILA